MILPLRRHDLAKRVQAAGVLRAMGVLAAPLEPRAHQTILAARPFFNRVVFVRLSQLFSDRLSFVRGGVALPVKTRIGPADMKAHDLNP